MKINIRNILLFKSYLLKCASIENDQIAAKSHMQECVEKQSEEDIGNKNPIRKDYLEGELPEVEWTKFLMQMKFSLKIKFHNTTKTISPSFIGLLNKISF